MPDGWTIATIGTSRLGREIEVWSLVPESATRRIVVVGGVHGNEPASPPVVRSLVDVDYPADMAVWLVPVANPDGVAGGVRTNGAGVDLNRNFGFDWRPSDGGPAPFSEPETAALVALIDQVRPDLIVWVHQPLDYVSSIGTTTDVYEAAWARGSGVPVRPDVTQHGGGETWANLEVGYPSMLVEIDTWAATPAIVAAHRAGFVELLTVVG